MLLGVGLIVAVTGAGWMASPGDTRTSGQATTNVVAVTCAPRWKLVAAPAIRDGEVGALAATASNDVWAVGIVSGNAPADHNRTLILHFDGARWTRIPSPSPWSTAPLAPGPDLNAVAAISATDAWAVGDGGPPNGNGALVLHWDGRAWKQVKVPSGSGGTLWDVSADASDNVWAVGTNDAGFLVLHWDGVSWHRIDVPSPPNTGSSGIIHFFHLDGVEALSNDDVWIGGDKNIWHWDGQSWRQVPAPFGQWDTVGAFSASSPTDVWAVSGPRGGQNTALHWDGSRWRSFKLPYSMGYTNNVVAISPDDAWNVSPLRHWNGHNWSPVHQPGMHYDRDAFDAIAAVNASDIWAVGWNPGDHPVPLFAHYSC
jgi:hypothetical protein